MKGSGKLWGSGVGAVAIGMVLALNFVSPAVAAPFHVGPSSPVLATHAVITGSSVTTRGATSAARPHAPAVSPSASPASGRGPHPNELVIYELAPGGATTVDPAVAYYTVDDEVITNVYETLIGYNQSEVGPAPSNFTPMLSTCVPGSAQCSSQFGGSTLVYANRTTGQPQYYTFEIDANARFYDPAHGASWPVYPSDVVFSFARTLSFATLPVPTFYNGWINAQALLPYGNPAWDGGIHNPWNNTPSHVLSSMLVNDSRFCPSPTGASGIHTNGCVTFDVGGSGLAWPYFLELVSDPLGGSVTPCGWFTQVNAGLPGFAGTAAPNGDGSCLLPGGATSTSDTSFGNYLRTVDPTAWDGVQELAATGPLSPQPAVQFAMVGSGPYYAASVSASGGYGSGGYTLQSNPAYTAPVGCAGASYCLPSPGKFIPKVVVYWDNDDTAGLQAMIGGQADSAGYDQSHTSTVLQLRSQGKYGLLGNVSTGTNWFMAFELNFSLSAERANDPRGLLNVPSDFLSSTSLRQFLVHAYPYTTTENTVWTVDGVKYGTEYGGAIPPAQASYYPSNVSWPTGNPDTNVLHVGSAAYWWGVATNASSPYYDPELASCSVATPCQFPVIGWIGAPSLDTAIGNWISEIQTISGGKLKPYSFDQTGTQYITNAALGNGAGNEPVFNWGWVPDYGDPTDYLAPMWLPNGTFSYGMAVGSQFAQAQYHSGTCGHAGSTFQDLSYWANLGEIPTSCQGVAYSAMVAWAGIAAHVSDPNQRILDYNLVEHIGNELALMIYAYMAVANIDYASWLSPTGINVNPGVGGGGVQTWYNWKYTASVYNITFHESGLTGTSWSVTLGGTQQSSTGNTIVFPGESNGSYTYTVAFVPGNAASPANGSVTVNGADINPSIAYTPLTGPFISEPFTEVGLVTGTPWSVIVKNVGTLSGNSSLANGKEQLNLSLPAGTYTFAAGPVVGYNVTSNTTFVPSGGPVGQLVNYTGQVFSTKVVTFSSTGLPVAGRWAVTVGASGFGGYTINSTSASISFYEEAGTTVAVAFSVPAGYVGPAASGYASVPSSGAVTVSVPITAKNQAFHLTFTESGLVGGTSWSVDIGNLTLAGTGLSLQYSLPNGTFRWTVAPVGGYTTSTPAGSSTVAGAAVPVSIVFVPYKFLVTFFESGLAPGGASNSTFAAWGVTIGATTVTSTTFSLSFHLANGTYSFSVSAPTGWSGLPGTGNVTVSGGNTTQVISFGLTYVVSFTTSTLPSGATWTVAFAGQRQSGNRTLFNFVVQAGVWTYAVTAPNGFTASPNGGTVTVNGYPVSVPVAFSQTSAAAPASATYLGSLAYGIIGVLALIAVIGFALAFRTSRPRAPPPSPPQTWTEGEAPMEGSGGTTPPPPSKP